MEEQFSHLNTPKHIQHKQIYLLGHYITSPANLGAIFRLADAFGVEKIYLSGTQMELLESNRFKRMARSTECNLHIQENDAPMELAKQLKANHFSLFSIELTNLSLPISQVTDCTKVALVLGGENYGIPTEILSICNASYHIPMYGINSSMNVAQATAIALYEITRYKQ